MPSDGSYGVAEGLMSSFPCTTRDGSWTIVPGLDINEFSQARIDATVAVLKAMADPVRMGMLAALARAEQP